MYEQDIWDFINEEWISWDEIKNFYYDMDESDYQYNFEGYEKYLQPQKNTINVSNKSKRNTSNTNNSKNKSKINMINIRKPHMALHYKLKKLNQIIESNIVGIIPSTIPEDISSLVPKKIWNTIHKDNQKDIEELFNVYYYQQWTATVLMAYRVLENVLKVHVQCDLNEDGINNLGVAIKKLEEHKYEASTIKKLQEYRNYRNNYMHGNKRAGAGEAKQLVVDVMSIAMHIHNIKP